MFSRMRNNKNRFKIIFKQLPLKCVYFSTAKLKLITLETKTVDHIIINPGYGIQSQKAVT